MKRHFQISLISLATLSFSTALNVNSTPHFNSRRAFLQKFALLTAAPLATLPLMPKPASAETITTAVKVTPIAHTFISSVANAKSPVKPLRENDATRFFTNARVVHLFYDGEDSKAIQTAKEVIDLIVKRKEGAGPGVTPGKVHFLVNGSSDVYSDIPGLSLLTDSSVKDALDNIPTGDVVIIAPKKSNGTIINGMLVEKSARDSGLEAGGSRSGGVISCLINGPQNPETLAVVDGGYSTSTILWYGV